MTPTDPKSISRWLWPVVADLACVLALAIGGRNAHEASEPAWILLAIAWPFALSAVLAHVGLASFGRRTGRIWPEGAVVLAATYVVGMLLRALSGRGLAPGFLVVAAVFLALTMLGWRAVVQLATRQRAARLS